MYENNLKCIVKDKTCFKNPNNPSSIDLFLTNFSNCFQNTTAIKYMAGYRKAYNTQYALMVLLEKCKQSLDNHVYAGAVIMDLSKAFDTINH